jgi:hypothetical protein
MEAAIENIVSFAIASNFTVNQLMEHEVTAVAIIKARSLEEPKWTIVMARNVRQVVNRPVKTLADAPKQEEHKLNLRFTSFEAKEGETKKKLV